MDQPREQTNGETTDRHSQTHDRQRRRGSDGRQHRPQLRDAPREKRADRRQEISHKNTSLQMDETGQQTDRKADHRHSDHQHQQRRSGDHSGQHRRQPGDRLGEKGANVSEKCSHRGRSRGSLCQMEQHTKTSSHQDLTRKSGAPFLVK